LTVLSKLLDFCLLSIALAKAEVRMLATSFFFWFSFYLSSLRRSKSCTTLLVNSVSSAIFAFIYSYLTYLFNSTWPSSIYFCNLIFLCISAASICSFFMSIVDVRNCNWARSSFFLSTTFDLNLAFGVGRVTSS
jgi:hypothetical protein